MPPTPAMPWALTTHQDGQELQQGDAPPTPHQHPKVGLPVPREGLDALLKGEQGYVGDLEDPIPWPWEPPAWALFGGC